MARSSLVTGALCVASFFSAPVGRCQEQAGTLLANTGTGLSVGLFKIVGFAPEGCTGGYNYSVAAQSNAWGGSSGPDASTFFSAPAGNGPQAFTAEVDYTSPGDAGGEVYWLPYVDGQSCIECLVDIVVVQAASFNGTSTTGRDRITITHPYGDGWDLPDHAHEFALRPYGGSTNPNGDELRFKAVMVGSVITETLGYFSAPQAPAYILRDPPGDLSYAQMMSGSEYCYGESFSVSDVDELSGYAQVTVGTEVTVGVFVETETSIGLSAGISASRSETNATNKEYKTCLTATATYTTALTGPQAPDVFIGTSVRYAYGVAKTVYRENCQALRHPGLAVSPIASTGAFAYTEDYIRDQAIPDLQNSIIPSLEPGTISYKQAVNQLAAWQGALAMNTGIKNQAMLEQPSSQGFDGGPSVAYTESITTSTAQSMDMNVVLEAGLSVEFSADVAGNGIEIGGEVRLRHEVGLGTSGSNQTTTSHTMSFADDDIEDHFEVPIYKDRTFGAPVFGGLDGASRTSCPYEGGVALDDPHLSVTAHFQQSEVVNNAPIGGTADFNLIIHNHGPLDRDYYLRVKNESNTSGAVLSAFGQSFAPEGIPIAVPAGSSLQTVVLTLTQPSLNVLDFDSIEMVLYSACDEARSSSAFVSAHFGEISASVIEHSTASVRCYPSPTTDRLRVELPWEGNNTIHVLDPAGRVVLNTQVNTTSPWLDVSRLASGEYVLSVIREGQLSHARFSVMH